MTFRIHFTYPCGTEDSLVVSGDSVEQIREAAAAALSARNIDSGNKQSNCWSEEVA